jgi:hypothetical protein
MNLSYISTSNSPRFLICSRPCQAVCLDHFDVLEHSLFCVSGLGEDTMTPSKDETVEFHSLVSFQKAIYA